jgi:exonuclease VII small subunit
MDKKETFQGEIDGIEMLIKKIEDPNTPVEAIISNVEEALIKVKKCKDILIENEEKMNKIINFAEDHP